MSFNLIEAFERGQASCAAGPWIPVEEQLPKEDATPVLVYFEDGFTDVIDGEVVHDTNKKIGNLKITHWATLNPPEAGK